MYALLLAQNADEKAVFSLILQRANLAVTTGDNLERALRVWSERPADLVLLALNSSKALDHVRRLRTDTVVPIVVVVNPLAEEGYCDLLEAGADLVIPRPVGARLLIAQVRALLRRAGGTPLSRLLPLTVAELTLDPTARAVYVGQQDPKRLTHLEFRLLYTLMIHRGQVLPTESIVEQVWGYSGEGDKDLVRGLIRRLRTKVEADPSSPRYILTASGLGYSFNPK